MIKFTVRYYNVCITKNDELTDVEFNLFLDYVMRQDNKQVENIYLKKMKSKFAMINSNDRVISLADYRIRKPKKGEKNTDNYENIDDDIFEQTNCFYQHSEKLFIVEYNHLGAKIPVIKKYLESFLPQSNDPDTDIWKIEFFEIPAEHSIQNIMAAQEITKLDIQLNITSTQVNYLKDITEENLPYTEQVTPTNSLKVSVQEYIEKTFQEILKTSTLFGGQNRWLSFSRGKKRKPLDTNALKILLNFLDLESDLFQSVTIDYKSSNGIVHNNINLKHSKVLSKSVECEEDFWKIIADSIESFYYNKSNRLGNGYYKRHLPTITLQHNEYPFNVNHSTIEN